MRAALWETSAGALAALLNSKAPLNKADLYTITLAGGSVLRWSGGEIILSGGGYTWGVGPGLQRTGVRFTVGIEVDVMTITVRDNVGTTINGIGLIPFIRGGGLNGARVQVDRAFWPAGATQPTGALMWFPGRIADVECDRYEARLTVKSELELLNVMVPRDLYQAGCLNTLYDPACGKAAATYTVAGASTSATDARRITFSHALAQAAGYFDLGVAKFTSGANAGISRTIKTHTSGALVVLQPWPFPVVSGDTFTVYPGCDKTQATCTTKFSNVVRFRGMPYVPMPETVA